MKKVLLLVLFIAIPFFIDSAFSQPPPPDPDPIPLDGGLTALIAAGLVYGARKLYLRQKSEDEG